MTVTKQGEDTLQITNGDLEALRRIKETYGLKDESDVIAFAIGVLDKSSGQGVTVRKEDGSTVRLMPSDSLRKDS